MAEKGTYSDPRCYACKPDTYLLCACGLETRVRCADIGCPDAKESNPKGWREVDGVQLPPIDWAAPAWMTGDYSTPPIPLDLSEYRLYDPKEGEVIEPEDQSQGDIEGDDNERGEP